MNTLKKIVFFVLFLSLFFVSASPTFAIPGQLIDNLHAAPQIPTCVCDETPLNTCNSQYKMSQLKNTELETINGLLTNNLAQEKKNMGIMQIILGGVIACSVGIIIFLRVTQLQGGRPFSEQQASRTG